jgi:hypothetical protein
MTTIVFLLEEDSAKALLEKLLPRVLDASQYDFKFIVFEGKSDLDKRIEQKLRVWLLPAARFVILRDKDSADCKKVKEDLLGKAVKARGDASQTLVRIACHEIEAWYLGDLAAVSAAFELPNLAKLAGKSKYRNPDGLANAKQELKRLTKDAYQEISGSRALGSLLDFSSNASHSFNVFIAGLRRLAS